MPILASWTRGEDKAFENAIATHSFDKSKEQWDKLASMVPTKTVEEIKEHYEFLVEDVGAIEAGKVPLPKYGNDETTLSTSNNKDDNHLPPFSKDQRGNSNQGNGCSAFCPSGMDQERKKGIPWTEEEHSVNAAGLSPNQMPITGQQSSNTGALALGTAAAPTPPDKHRAQSAVNMVPPVTGMYGTQIGQPVSAAAAPPPPPHNMVSAVGTPIMLSPPGHPHHLHHHPPPHYAVPVAYPAMPRPM